MKICETTRADDNLADIVWILGIYVRCNEENVYVTRVPNRRAYTLKAVLRLFVGPGSTLYSDGYSSYPHIDENIGVSHFLGNYNETFVTNDCFIQITLKIFGKKEK